MAAEGDASTKSIIESGGGLTAGEGVSVPTVKPSHWPKYVRVNTLKATLKEAVIKAKERWGRARSEGRLERSDSKSVMPPSYITNTLHSSLPSSPHRRFGSDEVAVHGVIDNVLVLPGTVNNLYEWDMVERGEVIIQDLSSCLTAVALGGGNGTRWWDVGASEGERNKGKKKGKGKEKNGVVMLDACAAPGNKTTHLAAIVNKNCAIKNKVIALDRASERIKILQKRVRLLGGESGVVEPRHQDFLKVQSGDKDLGNLKAILLDPSCSGSGIVNSPDRVENEDSKER